MRIRAPAPTRPAPARPATAAHLLNTETHWWDGSQIYGSTRGARSCVRTGQDGKLKIGADGLLPLPDEPAPTRRWCPGWWLGLAMMHTLFTLEHNAICDRLAASTRRWTDDELFQHARLINAALIAKIHTVEWTPAVIATRPPRSALRANWWGLAGGAAARTRSAALSGSEVISGIPGSETDHYGVPYALTEEFVAVYRMHPLIPDDYVFRAAADDSTHARARRFAELPARTRTTCS